MNKIITIAIFIALSSLALADPPPSNNYSIRSSVFGNSSATTGGGNYRILSTVGEPISAPSSTSTNYGVKSGFWNTLLNIDVPTFTDPLVFDVTGSSASFSVVVASNGSSSTIGFEYSQVSGDYSSGSTFSAINGDNVINSPVAGGSATVSGNITGLLEETTYFIRAFGENATGSSTSTEISFSTLSAEPTGHSTFAQDGSANTSITFTFDQALTHGAEGYLILQKATAIGDDDLPEDGNNYNEDETIGGATVIAKITSNSATQTIVSDLPMEKSWQFALVPYNWDGSNNTSHNYLTTDVPTITGFTIPTLGEWGMIVFGGLMLVIGTWYVRGAV